MTDVEEVAPPRAHARIVYLGPVSPHWEVYGDWGERQVLDEFRARVLARLVLLPREDPQFRRNRERIIRDAERELITIEWDLGVVAQPSPSAASEDGSAEADESADEAESADESGDDADATASDEAPADASDDAPTDD